MTACGRGLISKRLSGLDHSGLSVLIDTNVAIHWRDGQREVISRLAGLPATPLISAVTLVELQAGLAEDRSSGGVRRSRLERLLRSVEVLPFTEAEALAYGVILQAGRHDRRRVLDRMIAAQAIVAGLRLVTMNGRDFRDVPGLTLEEWPPPTPPPSSTPR